MRVDSLARAATKRTTHRLKLRRGQHSLWNRQRPPTGPQREMPLSRARNRQKSATLLATALRVGGATRIAVPLRAAPKPKGRRLPPIPSAG
eukprot:14761855-Alexandrium_andersonii.AAC.1